MSVAFPLRRMIWITTALVVIVAVLSVWQLLFRPPSWALRALANRNPNVTFSVDTDERAIALTIDDAPHPEVTPGILKALRDHEARATFFVIGSHAEKYPELVEAIRRDGHELGNHFYVDRMSSRLTSKDFVGELTRTDRLIGLHGPIKWCRPGSGVFNDRTVALISNAGYRTCLASAYPMDLRLPAGLAAWQFLLNVRPGAILVLHDGASERGKTIRILERVLPELKERGYRVLSVTELARLARQ